ncbi:MAG TPA: HDIG domain-containing protein, partial [Clostridia bacterium]|nr:HDIG domain-containing protein [Clostridia bacterium]
LLGELGILTDESKFDFVLYIGIASMVLVIEFLVIAYITAFNKGLLAKPKRLLMIYIIFIFTLIITRAVQGISIYLIPIAASSMLLSILLESRLALLINLCLTVLVSVITGNNITFIAMALVGGTVGAFSVINTQQRANIFVSGLAIGVINMITIVGIGFINSSEVMETLMSGFYGLLNGLFCSILTVGSLPAWESVFSVVTPLKLLELSNPNQPLLKKLLIEAPGTYHHSIIVGNLGESAADALGVNSLLARAGAFYHDIGKTKRPYFFKENQLTSDNPHDKLDPYLSSTIIRDHVKDGVELAKKHKLPVEIRDFIEQHHGTTLVAYFYHEAKIEGNDGDIDEDDFRYEGPKPRTKETAIVMLADSVEAAVRSLSSPTREKVEELIEKIIKNRLEDGQLDESNITLRELDKVKKSFLKVILSIFHERIEYPDIQKGDEDKSDGTIS